VNLREKKSLGKRKKATSPLKNIKKKEPPKKKKKSRKKRKKIKTKRKNSHSYYHIYITDYQNKKRSFKINLQN